MVDQLQNTDDFLQWKTLFNEVIVKVNEIGSLLSLGTVNKTSIVNAINEVITNIGALSGLGTTNKTSIVNAINELETELDGLVIGTHVQAFSSLLQAISALSSVAANRILYTTGTNTFSTSTITAYALSLLDDSSDSSARSTLGLGALAVLNTINNSNWSGAQLAINNGGTGATTAPNARTNLGTSYGKIALLGQAFS